MARARTVRLEEIDGEAPSKAETEAEELQEADDMEGGDLFAALDEMRGTAGVTFIVVRTFPSTPDQAGYVGSLTPAEFSLERMTELYGPGKYRVRVKGPKGWLPGGGTVAIARGVAPSATATPSGMNEVTAFLKMMQERDAARATESAARRDKWIELAIPGALTLLAAVLGKNNAPDLTGLIAAMKPAPGPSITDLVTSLSSLKTLTDSPKENGTQIESFLNILEKVKDLSGGEGKGESNWIDLAREVIREGLPMARPLLEGIQARQQSAAMSVSSPLTMTVRPIATAAAMPGSPLPSSTASTVPPSLTPLDASANSTLSGENDMLALFLPMIKEQLAKILSWAQAERDVELYAEVLLAELPPTIHKYVTPEKALEYLKFPQWFEVVTGQEARLIPHRVWCDEMRLELIDIIEEQIKREGRTASAPEQIVDPLNGEATE
jgi:hypothetical protein